jgi:hypothetical protein
VQHYLAFHLDLAGHVVSKIDLVCSDDQDATQKAKRLVRDHDIEVWRLDRRVAILRGHHASRQWLSSPGLRPL